MAVLPKLFYRFNIILIKNSSCLFFFLSRNGQADPKIYLEMQGTQNSQKNLEKEDQVWRTHTSSFQTYYKDRVIKTVWF